MFGLLLNIIHIGNHHMGWVRFPDPMVADICAGPAALSGLSVPFPIP